MKAGIVSYGAYVPKYRIRPEEIGRVWGEDGATRGKGLGIMSKSIPSPDEDVITIAVEAARSALLRAGIDPQDIGAIYTGSESHPYAVKPTSSVVAEAILAAPDMTAADYEFACKAGTAALQNVLGLVNTGWIKYGMAIGADTSQGAPGDPLEYSASAGGAAFIAGTERIIAKINGMYSYTTDTPDFWRREGQAYPSHGGRFTGEPAYFKHVLTAARRMMELEGTEAKDYDYVVLHQPNGKFPRRAAAKLGFTDEQLAPGLLTPRIGNTYSGAVPLGLSAVLDIAKPGDRILVTSFGSGAGSDAFDISVTDEMERFNRSAGPLVEDMINVPEEYYVDYATYVKFRGKIRRKGD